MDDRLNRGGARRLTHGADRGRIVLGGDDVGVKLLASRWELDAGPEIEQPDVVAVGEEVLHEIGFDGVDCEDKT